MAVPVKKVFRLPSRHWIWIALAAGVCVALFGCTTTILAPRFPPQPTTVCIVDYGRHASLVLPERNCAVEYEYGDWRWFALGQDRSSRILPTLLWPTQGTLGRRQLGYPPNADLLRSNKGPELIDAVYSIEVASDKAAFLKAQLAARYNEGARTEIFSSQYNMTFVKDAAQYTAFHNCNHELAAWLRTLGCQTKGSTMLSRFIVRTETK